MKAFKQHLKTVKFCLDYAFYFVPKETLLIFGIVIVAAALPYGASYYLGQLVDAIVAGAKSGSYEGLWMIVFLYALVNSIPTLLGNFRSYANKHWNLKFSTEIELYLLKKREEIDIAKYEDPGFQDLLQRAFRNGYWPIFNLAASQFHVTRYLVSLILGTYLAVHFDPIVYLFVILSAIPGFIVNIKYASWGWSIWAKDSPAQRRYADLRAHIQSKTFLIETKLLQSSNKLFTWMRKILVDFAGLQIKNEKSKFFFASITDLISFLGFGAGLYIIVNQVMKGEVNAGSLVYMLGTLSNLKSSINSLLVEISENYEVELIVKDVMEVINTKPVIVEAKNPIFLKLTSAPEITFENVGFKYQKSEKWSLRNISLTFKAGDNIGLVGNNGAGKTTLVKLLCRIYDPTEGRILINGVDLKEVSTKEWWSYMAVMFQDYASYDFLVKEAIAISRPDKAVNLTKVIDASKVAQSHDFIMEWKDRYDEQLGVEFKGKEPSKGQRQKLSIAKTLYRDGYVMILDEPTASVDAESEAKIFDSIENLPKDRTAILISHDFSTISQCDKIFVLEGGKLKEEGGHKELMVMKGTYSELYNLQAKRFKK